MVAGIAQLMPVVSLVMRRWYSDWTDRLTGDWKPEGLSAAKFAPSRTALLRLTQPRNTRPKSMPKAIISMTTGNAMANSTRPWPRGSSDSRRRTACAAASRLRGDSLDHIDECPDPLVVD